MIGQYPEQWLWSYKHWRYRPVDEANYYPFYANPSERFEREFNEAVALAGAAKREAYRSRRPFLN
jgi:hypothetical protein